LTVVKIHTVTDSRQFPIPCQAFLKPLIPSYPGLRKLNIPDREGERSLVGQEDSSGLRINIENLVKDFGPVRLRWQKLWQAAQKELRGEAREDR
jgi:hypothetical protein